MSFQTFLSTINSLVSSVVLDISNFMDKLEPYKKVSLCVPQKNESYIVLERNEGE